MEADVLCIIVTSLWKAFDILCLYVRR